MGFQMGSNMIIFGYGFLVGGLSACLILGLLSLVNHKSRFPEDPIIASKSSREVRSPEFSP
jgi:hypothetical protein